MVRISIRNINFKQKNPYIHDSENRKPAKIDFQKRLINIAKLTAEFDNQRKNGRRVDIFALCECWNRRIDGEKVARKIMCNDHTTGKDVWTEECFYDKWKEHLDPIKQNRSNNPVHGQFGDAALLASSHRFELIEDYIKTTIDQGKTWHEMIGGRIRIKTTKFILPIYSTHLMTQNNDANIKRQKKALRIIIDTVRNNWRTNDLTPVIVGDFNFYITKKISGENTIRGNIMEKDFYEIGHYFDHRFIEHFWVGKSSSFPDAGGFLKPVEGSYEVGGEFHQDINEDDPLSFTLSDHRAPYVELFIEGTRYLPVPWLIP